jgi:hypothetical protein
MMLEQHGRRRFLFSDDPHGLFDQMLGYLQMHADRLAVPALFDPDGIPSGCVKNIKNFPIFLPHGNLLLS